MLRKNRFGELTFESQYYVPSIVKSDTSQVKGVIMSSYIGLAKVWSVAFRAMDCINRDNSFMQYDGSLPRKSLQDVLMTLAHKTYLHNRFCNKNDGKGVLHTLIHCVKPGIYENDEADLLLHKTIPYSTLEIMTLDNKETMAIIFEAEFELARDYLRSQMIKENKDE